MIYFFSLYVLKNFFDFPSRYSLYVVTSLRCVTCFVLMTHFRSSCRLLALVFSADFLFSISASHRGQPFPFLFRSFLRSFRECKGKNLFLIPKFYFFYFLGPALLGFLRPFQDFLSLIAGCKGINLFGFCEIYFNFFFLLKLLSIYLQRTIPLPYLRAAKVRIVLTVANDWYK
jgi:hypothetical protein